MSAEAETQWTKKTKGNAKVYVPKDGGPAIVEDHYGVQYDGLWYETVAAAKDVASARKGAKP